jgi:hypothetical protein
LLAHYEAKDLLIGEAQTAVVDRVRAISAGAA